MSFADYGDRVVVVTTSGEKLKPTNNRRRVNDFSAHENHPIPPSGIQGETRLKEAAATELRTIIELVRAAINQSIYPGRTDCYVPIEAIYPDRVIANNNGRLYAYPYKLTDSNQVELGAPEEVILDHKPVSAMREAVQGIFLESRDEKGLRWLMKIIDAGESLNKNVYSDSVLREAAPLFEGARVFVKSDDEHLAGKGKSFRNLIGRITEPKFIEGKKADGGQLHAVLELLESAGEIPAKMLEAWKRNMAKDLFGFSIDAYGSAKVENGRASRNHQGQQRGSDHRARRWRPTHQSHRSERPHPGGQ